MVNQKPSMTLDLEEEEKKEVANAPSKPLGSSIPQNVM